MSTADRLDGRLSARVERVAAAMRAGERFVVHDESVCFVASAAEAVDAKVIRDYSRLARGVIGVVMSSERVDALGLPLMERSPNSRRLAYTVSVDATDGTTTGISAADRAATVTALLAREPDGRLATPGHVLPIRAAEGGILERNGVAEAVVELARLAGVEPVVAICEILDESGYAVRPEGLGEHPHFGALPAISPHLVRAHRRGLTTLPVADPGSFREAMRLLASGVVAITTRDGSGGPRGLLATAVSSYSAAPPSLLISTAHASRTHDFLVSSTGVGVHLLTHEQGALAAVLAGKADDKFAAFSWSWDGDVPQIADALAYLRCVRVECFTRYDHTILIADVEHTELGDAPPLVYYQGSLGWQLEAN